MPTDRDLFQSALDIADPAARAEYLSANAPDAKQLARVERLLAAHAAAGGFLEQPPEDIHLTRSAVDLAATRTASIDTAEHAEPSVEQAGEIIAGKYKLLQQIGEGGMGSVWMADQTEPVKRRVAVKLIRVDRGSSKTILSRFEAERQAIALMDHPHIAKLLDAGTTEAGQPYFVMELVKGIPLTDYCDAHKLSIPDRLNLFMQICSAVQHAHQKGIIHRDLKPTNILVESHDDKPVPKVIDFGLAKATSGMQLTEQTLFTAFGTVMGTPLYMAPEQAKFNAVDVDTRADVFALGVILYELLTGTTPIARDSLKKAALDEMLKLIREQEAPTPSSRLSSADNSPNVAANRQMEPIKLGRFVKGELDWIVMKSLSKERDRRYETANGFARDIERFLNHEPVQAGPPSTSYRLRKFVRRNRGPVVAAGLVLLTLVVGIAGTTLGLIEARRQAEAKERALVAETLALEAEQEQRRIAEANEAKANTAATAEQAAKEREADQRARAESAYARTADVLDAMTSSVTGDSLETQKELSDEQKKFLTSVLTYYKEFAAAKENDEQTRARTANAAYRVGSIEYRLGRKKESATAIRTARDLFEKLAPDFPSVPLYRVNLAGSHNNLGLALKDLGQWTEAKEQYQKALAIREKLVAEFPNVPAHREGLASSHNDLGILLADLGQRAEAKEHFQEALAIKEKLVTNFPKVPEYRHRLAMSHNNLGKLLAHLGQWAQAKEQYQQALTIQKKLAADFPNVSEYRKDLAVSHNNLGVLLVNLGQRREAEEQYQQALTIHEKLVADFPNVPKYNNELARSYRNLGNLLVGLGQLAEAKEQYQKALAIHEKLVAEFPAVPEYRQDLAESQSNMGTLLKDQCRFAEAEEQWRKALTTFEKLVALFPSVAEYRRDLAQFALNVGAMYLDEHRYAEAADWSERATHLFTEYYKSHPESSSQQNELLWAHRNRAVALNWLDRGAEAVAEIDQALRYTPKSDQFYFRIMRTRYLAKAGDHRTAGKQVGDQLSEPAPSASHWFYWDAALAYALCVRAAKEDAKLQAEYGDLAIATLKKSFDKGFDDVRLVKKDKDLDSIRDRDDFKSLVAELEKKFPPPPERSPPPREKK